MPNRYIYAGLYEDRDGGLKDIFYAFRMRKNVHQQRRNGKWFIHFRGQNGVGFRWWNTGRSKIDMITWDADIQRLWAHMLAPDGSWMPGKKTAGVALRHRELKRLFDESYDDPYRRLGRTVTQMGPRVNTAHTDANAVPGGARQGPAWIDPGGWDDDDDEDSDGDPPDIVEVDSDEEVDEDGGGLFVDAHDQDAVAPIEDSDDDEDEDVRRSNIRKGKQRDLAIPIEDSDDDENEDVKQSNVRKGRQREASANADEPPAYPFTGFFGKLTAHMPLLSPSLSPPPPPQSSEPIDLTEGEEEEESLERGRSASRPVDLSEDSQDLMADIPIVDLTTDPDIPIPSVEADEEDDDVVKIESRRSTPYRMRLEGSILRTGSQSPIRVYSHTPDSVQVPGTWPGRSRYRNRSPSISSIRTRIKSSPSSPTPSSATFRIIRERRLARSQQNKDTSQEDPAEKEQPNQTDLDKVSSPAEKDDWPRQSVAGEAGPSRRKPSKPIIHQDIDKLIILDD